MKKLWHKWQWLLILTFAFVIAAPAVYGAGGDINYWGADSSIKGGDEWTGEIVLIGHIADPSQATVSPDSADSTGNFPYDPIISIVFFAKLENRKLGLITVSGPAFVEDVDSGAKYSYFHAIGDRYGSNLLAEALQNFLQNEVKEALSDGVGGQLGSNGYLDPFDVVLTQVSEERDNGSQLTGGLDNLESPLFLSLKVTISVP